MTFAVHLSLFGYDQSLTYYTGIVGRKLACFVITSYQGAWLSTNGATKLNAILLECFPEVEVDTWTKLCEQCPKDTVKGCCLDDQRYWGLISCDALSYSKVEALF